MNWSLNGAHIFQIVMALIVLVTPLVGAIVVVVKSVRASKEKSEAHHQTIVAQFVTTLKEQIHAQDIRNEKHQMQMQSIVGAVEEQGKQFADAMHKQSEQTTTALRGITAALTDGLATIHGDVEGVKQRVERLEKQGRTKPSTARTRRTVN